MKNCGTADSRRSAACHTHAQREAGINYKDDKLQLLVAAATPTLSLLRAVAESQVAASFGSRLLIKLTWQAGAWCYVPHSQSHRRGSRRTSTHRKLLSSHFYIKFLGNTFRFCFDININIQLAKQTRRLRAVQLMLIMLSSRGHSQLLASFNAPNFCRISFSKFLFLCFLIY